MPYFSGGAGSHGAGLGLGSEPSSGEPVTETFPEFRSARCSNEENSSAVGAEEKEKGSWMKESLANSGQIESDMAGEDTTLNQTLGRGRKRRKTAFCVHFKKKQCRYGDACTFAHSAEELERPSFNGTDLDGSANGSSKSEAELAALYGRLNKCVINVPKQWQTADFKGFVDALGIKYQALKKQRGAIIGFLTFASVAQMEAAVPVLLNQTLRGTALKVSEARARPWELKAMANGGLVGTVNPPPEKDEARGESTGLETGLTENGAQVGMEEGTANEAETGRGNDIQGNGGDDVVWKGEGAYDGDIRKDIRDAVTPWWRIEYPQQLEQKEATIAQLLKRLVRKARKIWPRKAPQPEWTRHSKKRNGMACPLLGIIASPVTEGYRNKCEFTVGLGMDGKRMVGFQLGLYREGYTAIASPKDCKNVAPVSNAYVEIVQDFIRTSELSVWDKRDNRGVWRMVTVREGRAAGAANCDTGSLPDGEVLLMVQVSAQSAPSQGKLQSEYLRLKDLVVARAAAHNPPLPLTYLVIQVHEGVSNAAPPDSPQIILVNNRSKADSLPGSDAPASAATDAAHIYEHMCNLKFRLSLSAFFQVNTPAAEKLYRLAGEWASLTRRTLLFDVCCGTGTIGLTLASTVGKVVGIEMVAAAVEDAKKNAELNGIENCEFVCGKAEAVLGRLLAQYASKVAPADVAAAADVAGTDAADVEMTPVAGAEGGSLDDAASAEGGDVAAADSMSAGLVGGIKGDGNVDDDAPGTLNASEEGPSGMSNLPFESGASLAHSHLDNERINKLAGRENGINGAVAEGSRNEAGVATGMKGKEGASKKSEGAQEAVFSDIVAIVDPPRCGLHPTVLKALAAHERLRRLVYVSCNPESLLANVLELCITSEGSYQGRGKGGGRAPPPFRPVKAMAVDLFPHTPHCEMVMLLER